LFSLSRFFFRISLHSYHNIVFYTDSLTSTYMLEGPGAIFTNVRCSISQLQLRRDLIDLRWLAPRLVTLVNSMDSLCCLPFSLSLSLSHTFCHIKFARGAIIIRVFDKSVAKVSRTSLILHATSLKISDRCFFLRRRDSCLTHYFLNIVLHK